MTRLGKTLPGKQVDLGQAFRFLGAGPSYRELGLVVNWLRESGVDEVTYDDDLVELAEANGATAHEALDLAVAVSHGVESLIRVERGWDQNEGAIEPKSAAGRRTVPLLAVLRDHLDEHLLRVGRTGEELVLGRTPTDPFVPSTIDNRAQECWEASELDGLTLHEARHTFASLLIDSGANAKAVQEFVGHSKIQTTFDVYGHLLPGSHDEVRERMDAYLAEGSESTGVVVEDVD